MMRPHRRQRAALVPIVAIALVIAACGSRTDMQTAVAGPPIAASASNPVTVHATSLPQPAVPVLPFADNPDPTQCGIPMTWGKDDPAWITGLYQGKLIQPVVFLYNSHERREVVGQIPHGGRVRILLSQANPALNYYFVRSLDLQSAQEGWIPAPFVALDGPPPPLSARAAAGAGTHQALEQELR